MDYRLWAILGVLVAVLILTYIAGVRPSSKRDWLMVFLTLTWLFWLMGGFGAVRSWNRRSSAWLSGGCLARLS